MTVPWAGWLSTLRRGGGAFFTDVVPRLPCELTERKMVTALVNEADLKFENIAEFTAWDSFDRSLSCAVRRDLAARFSGSRSQAHAEEKRVRVAGAGNLELWSKKK